MEQESNIKTTLEDLKTNHFNYGPNQRYDLVVMVTSKAWIKNGKVSVWIEDPKSRGITIMCSFLHSPCMTLVQDQFILVNCQYLIKNVKIDLNRTKQLPTFAKYQVLLDQESTIDRLKESAR